MEYSEAWWTWSLKKNLESKILWRCPFIYSIDQARTVALLPWRQSLSAIEICVRLSKLKAGSTKKDRNYEKACRHTHIHTIEVWNDLNTWAVRARMIFIPKELWRIFDSKALVDFFHP